MLNPFPELLTHSMLAPFLLRVVAGIIFINLGKLALNGEKDRWLFSLTAIKLPRPEIGVKVLGILEILGGAMLIAGFYTQVASLVLAILTFGESFVEYKDPAILKRTLVFYLLLFTITLSLLLSGAGAFAIDIPL